MRLEAHDTRALLAGAFAALLTAGIASAFAHSTRLLRDQSRVVPFSEPPVRISLRSSFTTPADELLRGEAAARYEIANGQLMIIVFGLPAPLSKPFEKAERAIEKKYGLEFENRGCVVTDEGNAFMDGHNKLVYAELNRRFGPNFMQRFEREVEARASATARR